MKIKNWRRNKISHILVLKKKCNWHYTKDNNYKEKKKKESKDNKKKSRRK